MSALAQSSASLLLALIPSGCFVAVVVGRHVADRRTERRAQRHLAQRFLDRCVRHECCPVCGGSLPVVEAAAAPAPADQ